MLEIILGATRAAQLLFTLLNTGISAGAISTLPSPSAASVTHFALFTSLFSLLSLLFLVTSQFLFIKRFNGYQSYINTAFILELINWVFTFAAWVALAQFGAVKCDTRTCSIDRALLGVMVLTWVLWSGSLSIIARLIVVERRERIDAREIEMRIKSAITEQRQEK